MKTRILYVDDYPLDRELVRDALEIEHGGFEVTEAASRADFEFALANGEFDLVLSDFNILGFEGLRVVEAVHEKDPSLPVIIVTGTGSEEIAVEALKRGAADYVIKKAHHMRRLPMTIQSVLEKKRAERELRENQLQLEGLFHSAIDGIIMIDDDQKIVIFNPAAERMFGVTAGKAIGQSLDPFMPESARVEHGGFIRLFGESGVTRRSMETPTLELTCLRSNGELFPTEVSISKLELSGRRLYTAIIRDVTERKQTEEKIQRQINYLTALKDIDLEIISTFDMRASLDMLVQRAVALLQVDAAAVLLIDAEKDALTLGAGHGFWTDSVLTAHVKLGESYAGRAALKQSMVQIPDLQDDPNNLLLTGFLKGENFVSYYGIPLVVKGNVIGVLEVFNRSVVERSEEWVDFLGMLAGQAAIAIDNARLFESLQVSNSKLILAYEATIEGWSRALDLRDRETEGHTLRVTEKTLELARRMGIPDEELIQVRYGGLLHDIGKMGVPDGILLKPKQLTGPEWEIMKKHPIFAHDLLAPIHYLKDAAMDIPYCHHEKWNGTGYPRGLKGEEIPISARIFAIVDVYDAVTSDRPYRGAWSKEEALAYIESLSGVQFDPNVVRVFLEYQRE